MSNCKDLFKKRCFSSIIDQSTQCLPLLDFGYETCKTHSLLIAHVKLLLPCTLGNLYTFPSNKILQRPPTMIFIRKCRAWGQCTRRFQRREGRKIGKTLGYRTRGPKVEPMGVKWRCLSQWSWMVVKFLDSRWSCLSYSMLNQVERP